MDWTQAGGNALSDSIDEGEWLGENIPGAVVCEF